MPQELLSIKTCVEVKIVVLVDKSLSAPNDYST